MPSLRALHVRLTLALAALLAVLALGLLFLLRNASDRYADELRQRLDSGIAMYVVRELPLMHDGAVNESAWRELANRAMTVNPSAEVYLLDPGGNIVTAAVPPERLQRRRVSLGPILEFLRFPDARPLYADDPTRITGKRVFSVAQILDAGVVSGYLFVVLGGQPEQSIAASLRGSYALRAAAVAIGLALLTALLAGAGLFAVLTRRLRALDQSLSEWSGRVAFAAGQRLDVGDGSGDEINALVARFRLMSRAIELQLEELKATDELRRELVANVSHDLRTPLAALRGYIETLMIRGGASAEDIQFHLGVALRQADRLGSLIDALLELARLESQSVAPRVEVFAIAELLQDIVMRFRLGAEKRGVALNAFLDPIGVMVLADLELMDRVLGNLLENAIRHTPRGGQVRVETSAEANLVRIRVVDTGEGIDPQHMPHIFDRFYSSRRLADRNRTGLGLAIVKRIMDLHAQKVTIQSQAGAGTTVEVTLQRHAEVVPVKRLKSA